MSTAPLPKISEKFREVCKFCLWGFIETCSLLKVRERSHNQECRKFFGALINLRLTLTISTFFQNFISSKKSEKYPGLQTI